jgi:hypothetical protein
MATLMVQTIPIYNPISTRLEREILVQNAAGELVLQTEVVDTKTYPDPIGDSGSDMVVDNISSELADAKLEYSTTSNFIANSLAVFYNGLNITNDITIQSANTFIIDSDYENVIDSNGTLIAMYSVQ